MKYREQIEAHLLRRALQESNITGTKNKHMTHIEDLVILGGAEGMEHALDTFNSLFLELKGETPKSQRRVSVKIDGAPAVFVWNSFPGLQGPGISTKGLFAKTPKAAYNHEMIDQYFGHAPDLAKKLKMMFDHISELGLPDGEIWQGDFLYDRDSLSRQDIDGDPYIIFHPNTIVYAVPEQSEIGQRIAQTDVGVVWHTVYTGDSVENVRPSFSAKAENLNNVPAVFSTDPYIKSVAGEVTLTAEETDQIDSMLTQAEEMATALTSNPQYDEIVSNEDFVSSFFTVYQNATIKAGQKTPNPDTFIDDFYAWATERVSTKAEKKIAGLKTEKGQNAARAKLEADLQTIEDMVHGNADVLTQIVRLIKLMTEIKEVFTRKMDALGAFQAYLRMKSGEFRSTGQEGFAISDIAGNVVKFIDRTEFSYANFSTDVAKGWESDRRVQEEVTYSDLVYMTEEVLEIPDDTHPRMQQLLSRLASMSSTMSRAQIAELFHATREILEEEDPKLPHIQTLLDQSGKFRDRLLPLMLRTYRSVDDDILQVLLEERERSPLLSADAIRESKQAVREWESTVRERFIARLSKDDLDTLIRALQQTYTVAVAGNGGMGSGEVLYMILTNGQKPERGDLMIPSVGELEIKGNNGRMQGVTVRLDSIEKTYRKMLSVVELEFPEIVAIMDQLPKAGKSSSLFSLTMSNLNKSYPLINEALGGESRRKEFYSKIWRTFFDTLHAGNVQALPEAELTTVVDQFTAGDFEQAAVRIAALQFHLYKNADNFDGMLLVAPDTFMLIETIEDVCAVGALSATSKSGKPLQILPGTISPGNEQGAAAGFTLQTRFKGK